MHYFISLVKPLKESSMTGKLKGAGRPYAGFVRTYMAGYINGDSLDEIARSLGTTPNTVLVTAAMLRRHGVRLPKVRERFDASALNKIIRRHQAAGVSIHSRRSRKGVWS